MKCLECQRLMRPYLLKELSDQELAQFLDHIDHCQNCYEELELNLAVYSALDDKSELRDNGVYDFEEKLKRINNAARRHLRIAHSYVFLRRLAVALAEAVLLITIITAVELNMFKDHSKTHLYKVMHHGKTMVEIITEQETVLPTEAVTEDLTELTTEKIIEELSETVSEKADGKVNEKDKKKAK